MNLCWTRNIHIFKDLFVYFKEKERTRAGMSKGAAEAKKGRETS